MGGGDMARREGGYTTIYAKNGLMFSFVAVVYSMYNSIVKRFCRIKIVFSRVRECIL